jgi:DNA-binding LacI/PurR family transcriptional regulator/serine phosphatase RsbU (regulator of sigma subunit)
MLSRLVDGHRAPPFLAFHPPDEAVAVTQASEARQPIAPPAGRSRSRKGIALLVNDVFSTYQATFRSAIERAARRHGYNLVVFMGREIGHADPNERAQNAVYGWVSSEAVEGALVLSGTLANFAGIEGLQALCERLRSIPIVSVGMEIPGHSSVLVNNRRALARAVEHLIHQHQRKRIAYIGGPASNEEAQQRLAGYRDALAAANIEVDERLIAVGRFNLPSGQESARAILARGVDFDAVVAANDDMALGAMDVLRERGLRVPEEILVVGFDDTPVARFAARSLTTVAQPIDEMAEAGVEALLAATGGRPEKVRLSLDAHLVVRESCGCGYATARPAASSRAPATSAASYLERERERWIDWLCPSADPSAALWRPSWGPALLEALARELERKDGSFLLTVEGTAEEIRSHHVPLEQLALFLRRLQQRFDEGGYEGASHFDLEQLWMRARALMAGMTSRHEARNVLDQVQGSVTLRAVAQRLSVSFDTRTLARELERSLPELGVDVACVALHPAADPTMFRSLIALEEGRPAPVDPQSYTARSLLPDGFPRAPVWSLLVWAVTFENDVLGMVAVSGKAPPLIGESLRAQIGAALHMGALHARVVEQTAFQERLSREQLAQEMAVAQRIQTALAPKDLAVPSLAIAARSEPADEVGGDYYDVIPVDGGCWIGIGDVAGHGLMSGLVMLMIQSIVSTLVACAPDASPARLVIDVNRVLVPNLHKRLQRDEHATFALLRFFDGGRICFAGAHEDLIVWRAATAQCESIATEGTWLGLVDDIAAATWDKDLQLSPGDLLVLVTDGILESINARNEPFGMDAVMRIVGTHARSSPETIVDELISAVRAWAPRQRDDITCLVARYEGARSAATA